MTNGPPKFISNEEMAKADADVPRFISNEEMAASEPRFGSELGAIGAKGIQGVGEIADLAAQFNPFQVGGPRLFGLNPNAKYLPSPSYNIGTIRESLGFEREPEEPKTKAGQVLGEVARYSPGAAIPGGFLSSLFAGLAAGATKAGGGGETAQTVAGILGSFTPQAAAKTASRFLGKTADDFFRMGLNVQRSDLAQSMKKMSPAQKAEAVAKGRIPLKDSMKGTRERGLFKGSKSAEKITERNNAAIEDLGNKVSRELADVDAVRTTEIVPEFPLAEEYIAKATAVEGRDALLNQFQRRMAEVAADWDGSAQSLQKIKQGLYKIAYKGANENDSKLFDRLIAADLKNSIEKAADDILEGAGAKIRDLNIQQGEHLTLRDFLTKMATQEEMAGGLAKGLRRAVVSPIGGGTAGLMVAGLTGAPAPALFAGLGALATTKTGQYLLSDLFRGGGNIARLFGTGTKGVGAIPAIASSDYDDTGPLPDDELFPGPAEGHIYYDLADGKKKMNEPRDKQNLTFEDVDNMVRDVSAEFGVNPRIIRAMVEQESSYNPEAVSEDGAIGLLQLMPDTALEMAEKLGLEGDYSYFDPMTNLRLGTAYYKQLLDQFNDHELALTAYHSGPGRVKKLLAQNKATNLSQILDDLGPYGRAYAKSVLNRV